MLFLKEAPAQTVEASRSMKAGFPCQLASSAVMCPPGSSANSINTGQVLHGMGHKGMSQY